MDVDPDFLRRGLIAYLLLVASVVVHEWAHAFVAYLLGDDTPRADGRLTLDPRAHFDLFGTLVVPAYYIFFQGSGYLTYGWGQPVAINPNNFRHPVRDDILVSLAGPAANLILALVATVLGALLVSRVPRLGEVFGSLIVLNVSLALVNLLPVPPLDGGAILWRRLIGVSEETYQRLSMFSWPILILLSWVPAWNNLLSLLFFAMLKPYAIVTRMIDAIGWQQFFHH